MKMTLLKILALGFLVLISLGACSGSPVLTESGNEGSTVGNQDSKEMLTTPSTSPETLPALPTPPTPRDPKIILEDAHGIYSKYINSDLVNATLVREKWNEHLDPVPAEKVTQNIVYINNFLAFIYDVDPQVRIGLFLVGSDYKYIKGALITNDLSHLNPSLEDMVSVNRYIRGRILKAAQIYGVHINETPTPLDKKLQDLMQIFQDNIVEKIESSPGYFKDSFYWIQLVSGARDHAGDLFQSMTFPWTKEASTPGFFSFENLKKEPSSLLVYSFDDDQQGGFGAVDSSLVGF